MANLQSLVALLQATQSIHAGERVAAEQNLTVASRNPEFCVALATLLADENNAVPLRQLAGVMLKQFASRNWATLPGDPDASLVVVSESAKSQVKQLVPRALASAHSKVRTAAALSIAAIGRTDFPGKWPSLLSDLVACLRSPNNPHLAAGALKCLDFLATSQLADDQVPLFLQTVFPALHAVFISAAFDESAKSRAASVVAAVVLWIGTMMSQNPDKLTSVISQSMQMWMDGFCSVLAMRDAANSSCQLKIKIMTILSAYAHYFPKQFRPYVGKVAELVWANLLRDVPVFEQSVVQQDLLSGDVNDSDGNATGFELLVASYLDFVSTLATKKSFKELVTRSYPALVRALFSYTQLSAAQCEQFLSDPNEFVAAEDDELQSYSIRFVCVELVQHLASVYRKDFLRTLLVEARELPLASSWKLRESFLYLVGSVVSDLRKHQDIFDPSAFVSSVLPDIGAANPFLRGRALWCASQCRDLPPPLVSSVCEGAVRLLSNPKEQLPVRFAAVKAIASLCSLLPPDVVVPAVLPAVDSCCRMFSSATAETLPSALETLEALLESHVRVCVERGALVAQQLLLAWQKFAADQFVTELIVDLVTTLARVPECVPHLASRFAPAISSFLLSSSTPLDPALVVTAVELLGPLAGATPNCLAANPAFGHLFGRVMNLAWHTDDPLLAQACTRTLLGFVMSNGPALSSFRGNDGQTGTAMLISLIGRLLDPARDESCCDGVGKLVLKMIQLLDLGPALPGLLAQMLARLAATTSPSLVQTLVLVFARLIHRDANSALSLLANMKSPDGTNALTFLLRIWVDNQLSFYGSYQTKVTLFALVLLFKLNSPQLNSIKVKGVEIVPTGRSTRSKGPIRYSEIPLQQKIFEVCVAAFVDTVRDAAEINDEEEMDEFSSEDDDFLDEEDFDHGTPLDALLRMANDEEADMGDRDDPEFKDDPVGQRDMLLDLRDFLFVLMKQQGAKAFEANVEQIGDSDAKSWFKKIWPAQVGVHLAAMQKKK